MGKRFAVIAFSYVLILCGTLFAQTALAPAGWSSHREGELQIFTPDALAAGDLTLTIHPKEPLRGASLQGWFERRVNADAAKRGGMARTGKAQYQPNMAVVTHAFSGSSGKPYFVAYNAIELLDGSALFATIECLTTAPAAMDYAKQGGAIVAAAAKGAGGPVVATGSTTASSNRRDAYDERRQANEEKKRALEERRRAVMVQQPGTGVKPEQIAMVLHEGRGVTTAMGYQYKESVDLLLKDGWARLDLEIPPSELNVEASKRLEPEKWRRWRRQGKDFEFEDEKKGAWAKVQAVVVEPLEVGSRLNTNLVNRSFYSMGAGGFGGSTFTKVFTFSPDGRFERLNSSLHATGAMQSTSGFSGSAASLEDKNGRSASSGTAYSGAGGGSPSVVTAGKSQQAGRGNMSGSYKVSGYTLELKYDDGTVQRLLAFYVFPDSGKDDVYIGDVTYSRPKK